MGVVVGVVVARLGAGRGAKRTTGEGPDERARGREMADRLAMPVLTRMWQMALKALEEVASAPNAMMAAEMAVIRMTHVADMPTPGELVAKLSKMEPPAPPSGGGGGGNSAARPVHSGAEGVASRSASSPSSSGSVSASGGQTALAVAPDSALVRFPTFQHVVDLIRANRDVKLLVEVETGVRLVSYQPGRIEFEPSHNAAADLSQRLGSRLQSWTGARWAVSVSSSGGQPSIAETRDAEKARLKAAAAETPIVAAILKAFPGATIGELKTPADIAASAATEALAEVEDEWDPFEEE